MKLRVTVVTFARLGATNAQADATPRSIARALLDAGNLHRLLCLGHEGVVDVPRESLGVPPFAPLPRWLGLGLELAGRLVPLATRRLHEEAFDRFVARDPALLESDVVVFAKPVFPRAAAAARAAGARTLGLTTILHPSHNAARLAAEESRVGLHDATAYGDARRIANIEAWLANLDVLMARSEAAERSYAEYGVPPERIRRVPETGVDCDAFPARDGPREPGPLRVLHVSGMGLIKGIRALLEAWAAAELPDAELQLGGTLDACVRALLERSPTVGVRRLGPLSDPGAHYRAADLFVSPSLADLGPATVLEAMASGTPVIVSDACGASSLVVHGESGFVYPYDRPECLAEHLRWAASHRERLAEMGRAARRVAESQTRDRFGREVARLALAAGGAEAS